MKDLIRDSFIAGILIGLGCLANICSGNAILGPFLFALGLFTVIIQNRDLYTGKIGYLSTYREIPDLIVMLMFNLVGIGLLGAFYGCSVDSSAICALKYSETLYEAFLKSVGCGMLMYIAVYGYSKTNNIFAVIMPVMMFIICGFDHCVANYGYMALNGDFYCWQLPVWVVGNTIGSLIISKI